MADVPGIDGWISMTEAGRRMGVSGLSARRALTRDEKVGKKVRKIGERAYVVSEEDLTAFIAHRAAIGYSGRGAPRKKAIVPATAEAALPSPDIAPVQDPDASPQVGSAQSRIDHVRAEAKRLKEATASNKAVGFVVRKSGE